MRMTKYEIWQFRVKPRAAINIEKKKSLGINFWYLPSHLQVLTYWHICLISLKAIRQFTPLLSSRDSMKVPFYNQLAPQGSFQPSCFHDPHKHCILERSHQQPAKLMSKAHWQHYNLHVVQWTIVNTLLLL